MVTLTLCTDQSVSVSLNDHEVTRVFTDLPKAPFWLAITMWMQDGKIAVLQPELGKNAL